MKKTFTILIAAIAAILMMAQPGKVMGQTRAKVTFVAGTNTGTSSVTISGITVSMSTMNESVYKCYKSSSMSITSTAGNITGVTVTCSANGTAKYGPGNFIVQDGQPGSYTYESDGPTGTWTGDAASMQLYASTNQVRMSQIEVTYTPSGGGSTVDTPEIKGETPFLTSTSVSITCGTAGASIQYSLDNGTNWSDYTSSFTITETTTVKAKATKNGMTASAEATKTFTKITPLANIAALTANTETGTYYVTFTNATVTYTNGNFAYIQDASGAVVLYKSEHGYAAGDVLNGTATVSYKLQNSNPQITALSGVTKESGNAPEPNTIAQSSWSYTFANVLSQYFKITDATLTLSNNKYYVSLNSENIQLYKQGGSISTLDLKKKYTITGFPMMYGETKELQIFSDPGVEDLTIESSALQLSYQANPSGSMTVGYSNFTPTSVTAALYSDSGCNTSFSDDWISITSPLTTPFTSLAYNVSANEGLVARTVYMKVSATNANNTTINKVFTITQDYHHTYSVTYKANNGGSGEDVVDAGHDYNTSVTVKPNDGAEGNPNFSKAGYTFQNWNTNAGGTGTSYDPADNEHNTFNIIANTILFAQWQADSHDLNTAAMSNGSVSFKVNNTAATTAKTDETVTIIVTPASGYKLSGLTVTNDATSGSVTVSNTNTFTMPASSVTVSAEFEIYYALTIDFESALNTYSNWEFDSNISRYEYSTGSYCGINYDGSSATTSCTIATKNKIARPGTLSFYVKRTGSNTKTAVWKVYTKADNGDWTQRGSDIDATASDWTEASIDLSSYTNVYVKIAYDGNNAQYRAIDDICLEYTPTEYAVSVSSVDNGTISASDGTTTITEGNSANIESAKTVTLTAEGDATHMFSAWSVSGATVADASSATTTFEMPANAVTVSASFVECWTFTYNINGNVVTEKYAKNGASITLPTTSEYVPEGYAIKGWTATEGDVSSPITSATATQDRNLFAVFGKITYSDFTLVESAPSNWSGYYLIVYNNSTTLNTHSNNLDVNSYGTIADIAKYYNNKVIESNNTTIQYIVKIEQTTNGYSIYAKDGYLGYDGATSGTGGTGTYLRWDTEFKSSRNEWTLGVGSIVSCYYSSRAIRYNTSNPRFAIYATDGQAAIQLFKTTVSNEGAYTHIYPSNATATGDINVSTSGPIVIESGATLDMGSYVLSCNDATKLIIEDGGQLILKNNNTVKATVKKTTAASSTEKAGANNLYAIASPVNDILISSFAQGTHNVYRFDEPTSYWNEYRSNNTVAPYLDSFTKLAIGRGYLYRSSVEGIDLAGDVTGGNASGEISYTDLSYAYGIAAYKGLNLVGNPFTHDISWSNLTLSNVETTGCYMLVEDPADNDHGKWKAVLAANVTVKPMQAFFVQTTNETASITFKNTAGSSKGVNYANDNIMFSVKNSKCSDEAYVMFAEGHGLNKIEHRNSEIPMLYIINNGQNYAIADMSDDTEVINIGFEAKTMGQYTFSIKTEGQYSYMSLYDKVANLDVDMLREDSYTFVGTPNDRKDRFVLRLNYNAANIDTESDVFAYQNGNDIIVRGNGELQIFDVMGRFVTSEYINGVQSFNADALSKGVYVLRIVGTEIKTQKIVVR